MPAADHAEAVGRGDIARAGKLRDRFLARIDDIGIDFGFCRIRAKAEHAVFRLERHIDARGHIVGDERWYANAQIYVEAVLQLQRCPCRSAERSVGKEGVSTCRSRWSALT